MRIGLDVGSTTLKCVVLDDADQIVYQNYERHLSRITEKTAAMLSEISGKLGNHEKVTLCISGSAGMGLADDLGIPFVQEVYATRRVGFPPAARHRRRHRAGRRGRQDPVFVTAAWRCA